MKGSSRNELDDHIISSHAGETTPTVARPYGIHNPARCHAKSAVPDGTLGILAFEAHGAGRSPVKACAALDAKYKRSRTANAVRRSETQSQAEPFPLVSRETIFSPFTVAEAAAEDLNLAALNPVSDNSGTQSLHR